MTDQPERPIALTVLPENIPAALKALHIWVCWRYEWNGQRQRWTKVPYIPFTTSKASSTRASSWRSFQAAYNCYMERRDFFDGVFACLSADDPYTGGDFDHSEDQSRIPETYAERSPSGNGSRFIGIGTIPSACKKPQGELYNQKRFLSITGHRLDGFPADIRPIQPALDALYDELKGSTREIRAGTPGNGSRAAAAAAIPQEDYADGRRLLRNEINSLLGRLHASARPKAPGKETQLYYILQDDIHGLHQRYPYAGAVRGDGSLDSSQIRAIFASGVRIRGFTFPQYVALFYHFYGAECLAKWGTTQAFREEAATLWFRARSPRAAEAAPPVVQPAPRGRAGNHAELLNQLLTVLHAYRAGASAIVSLKDVGADLGVHKDTALRMINQLVAQGKITKRKHGQHGGLIIDFPSELIYSQDASGGNHQNGTSDSANSHLTPELIYENSIPLSIAVNDDPMIAEQENDGAVPELIYSPDGDQELIAPECAETATETTHDEREIGAPLIVYKSSTVYPQRLTINSEKRGSIADAVGEAFEALPRDHVLPSGELKRWPVTDARVVEYVQAQHAAQGWKAEAIAYWAGKLRKRRKAQAFDELARMRREAIEKKAGSVRKQIARAETKAATEEMPELREWYAKRAAQLTGQQAMLGWELGRRDALDSARIERDGYSQGEQAEMLDLVAQATEQRPPQRRAEGLPQAHDVGGMVARLKARHASGD